MPHKNCETLPLSLVHLKATEGVLNLMQMSF